MSDPLSSGSVPPSSPMDPEPHSSQLRLPVDKTYKIFVNGAFSRTESGRYYPLRAGTGDAVANVGLCSPEDVRAAVVAARSAHAAWSGAAAYLRGQILYRIAEMLEGRTQQFVAELIRQGDSAEAARAEVCAAVDRWVYYAGWTDKVRQVFSSVNPVQSSHFNFSVLESVGVVGVLAPEGSGLLGLVSTLAPILTGGNTCVVVASATRPLCAVTLGEVLNTADVPAGVVNILTGRRDELQAPLSAHLDVDAVIIHGADPVSLRTIRSSAAENVTRIIPREDTDWFAPAAQGPYRILDTMEVKTTWHPVGR